MTSKIDMIGNRYGRLTVVAEVEKNHRGFRYNCSCECGGKADAVAGSDLRNGKKTSCGCRLGERRRTHGMTGTRLYNIWGNMKKRCSNPTDIYQAVWGAYDERQMAKLEASMKAENEYQQHRDKMRKVMGY